MLIKLALTIVCSMLICCSHSLPTVYKFNENKLLEPDLVPVSSTVIPLPVYQVGYGLHVEPSLKDEKVKKPEGPITLVTVHNVGNGKKKATVELKSKLAGGDVSSVKEVNKKHFDN